MESLRTCLIVLSWLTLSLVRADADGPAEEMATAAARLLATLSDEERPLCAFGFDAAERTNFHFVPDDAIQPQPGRRGLRFDAMNDASRVHAHALLAAGLSHRGYLRATSIMALEQILAELEQDPERRDAGKYYISVFGTPDATGTWGWRCEGHHLSLNVTIRDGKLFAVTPLFLGTNPGKVVHGPQRNLEVLRELDALGFQLVNSLDDPQRARAIVSSDALAEIVTLDHPQVDRTTLQPVVGIPGGEMSPAQRALLLRLVSEYVDTFREDIVAKTAHAEELGVATEWTFAWFGSTQPGAAHYYRIQSKSFVLELANVQNKANHVHAAWRDFDGDFGRDLLGEHYLRDHAE